MHNQNSLSFHRQFVIRSLIIEFLVKIDARSEDHFIFDPEKPKFFQAPGPYRAYFELPATTESSTSFNYRVAYHLFTYVAEKSKFKDLEECIRFLLSQLYSTLIQLSRTIPMSQERDNSITPFLFWRYRSPYIYIDDYLPETIGPNDKINPDLLSLKTRFAIPGVIYPYDGTFQDAPDPSNNGSGEATDSDVSVKESSDNPGSSNRGS